MFSKLTVLIGFIGMSLFGFSQNQALQLDTTKYLANQFIVHQVVQGQTLFSISNTYGLKPADTKSLNASVDNSFTINPGQILRLPVLKQGDAGYNNTLAKLNKEPIMHKVQPKEGLFSIYKAYGLGSIAQLKKWNQLSDDAINIDQELIVGWRYISNADMVPPTVNTGGQGTPSKGSQILNPVSKEDGPISKQGSLEERYKADKENKGSSSETGAAIFFSGDNRMMSSNYYALYNGAPRGSIIEVINLENQQKVFVKVIGGLPDTGENTGAMIKLTSAAQEHIKATSSGKLRVKVNFYK